MLHVAAGSVLRLAYTNASNATINDRKQQHLWSNVVRSATECISCSASQHPFFAHAKISQLAMAVSIKQNVVQL